MSVAIKFEDISKQYRLGEVGTGTLSHDLHRAWASLRGKPDPFAKVGAINDRTQAASGERKESITKSFISRFSPFATASSADPSPPDAGDSYVWALRNINFEVQQGEILGIIGRNGAGKSTLLKLLSRVTAPTTGSIKAKGRIASLLEVGTGFHPELTGRENIYLNGAILGMRRREITNYLDEIVEFSGCAKYIDTPVKRYSSGMTVRLGFAVAAHLDCETLVVDEVLAVGDAEFQKKCIGKMKEVSRGLGKTVLFVSHNLQSISTLTNQSIVIEQGEINYIGDTASAISHYLKSYPTTRGSFATIGTNHPASIVAVDVVTSEPESVHTFGKPLLVKFRICCRSPVPNASLSFQVLDDNLRPVVHLWVFDSEKPFCREPGEYEVVCRIQSPRLYMGQYSLVAHFGEGPTGEKYQTIEGICAFDIEMFGESRDFAWAKGACVYIETCRWELTHERVYE